MTAARIPFFSTRELRVWCTGGVHSSPPPLFRVGFLGRWKRSNRTRDVAADSLAVKMSSRWRRLSEAWPGVGGKARLVASRRRRSLFTLDGETKAGRVGASVSAVDTSLDSSETAHIARSTRRDTAVRQQCRVFPFSRFSLLLQVRLFWLMVGVTDLAASWLLSTSKFCNVATLLLRRWRISWRTSGRPLNKPRTTTTR